MYLFLTLIFCLEAVVSDLIFEDNFNELNETKWQIFGSNSTCSMLSLVHQQKEQLSCSVNSEQNLKIISGTLVLTAIQQNFLNHSFTSATVVTREPIRIEKPRTNEIRIAIRAALPSNIELQAQVLLIPNENIYNRATNGMIIVFENRYNLLEQASYDDNGQRIKFQENNTKSDLSEFHTFSYRINDLVRHMSKECCNKALPHVVLDPFGEPYQECDCANAIFGNEALVSYKLVLSIHVLNKYAGTVENVIQNSKSWNCSSFIIDWVKIFITESDPYISTDQQNNQTSSQICTQINRLIGRLMKTSEIPSSDYTTFSIYVLSIAVIILILIMISVSVILYRKKSLPQNTDEIYDQNENHTYDNYNYANPYEDVRHDYLELQNDHVVVNQIDQETNQ